jgi:2-amino-4-hydroxy-6-hydroxymethyldihydropteridine diphosphokinase
LTTVFLGLGSNLGDRQKSLTDAIALISDLGELTDLSRIYESRSWGYEDPRPYLNMCCTIQTELSAEELHGSTLAIEKSLGREGAKRKKGEPYRSRTIDIDILFYGSDILETDTLSIPHPQLHLRKFVLQPLTDINPNFVHPVIGQTVGRLKELCQDNTELKEFA